MYRFQRIGMNEVDIVKELFTSVFTIEPWMDDWSDEAQLDLYLSDLMGQSSSLVYGLFDGDTLVGVSMGHIKHWYTGTEYYIDELCIRTDRQGSGLGTRFLGEIEKSIRDLGLKQIFLQTERHVPAYGFYLKNGFTDLKDHASLVKQI